MSKPTYYELNSNITKLNNNIKDINEEISLYDNEYELAKLASELDFYENELLVTNEYLEKTISKGRNDE